MKKATFTYDDVSVSPDRQIGMHSHPQWELSHVVCGAGTRTIGELSMSITEGEILFIPPDIPHVWMFDPNHTDAGGNISNISVFFETETLDRLSRAVPELDDTIRRIKSKTEAVSFTGNQQALITRLLHEMRGLTPAARLPLFMQLLQAVAETDGCEVAGSGKPLSRADRRLEKVRVYCYCNFARDISLDDIAAHVGMNKSAFCTFMRKQTGMTLSEYVNGIRLQRAREMLLHSDRSIASVAYDAGFSNVTYFNRLFKNKYRLTPKALRMETVDNALREYVEECIIPRYAGFDKAHRADHVEMVIAQSMNIASQMPDIDRNMVYATAAFHDLGLINGRENHHVDSRRILEADEFIKAHFTPQQIHLMGEAVEDHRASKSGKPRNIYGLIVAEADRFIDCETIIRRTIQYGLRNYPQLDRQGHFDRTVSHLTEKYGPDGYLKIWFPESDNARRLAQLRQTIANPTQLRTIFDRIFAEETAAE